MTHRRYEVLGVDAICAIAMLGAARIASWTITTVLVHEAGLFTTNRAGA